MIGTNHHLLINGQEYSWVDSIDNGILCLGGAQLPEQIMSIDYISKLYRKNIPTFSSTPHAKFFHSIGMHDDEIKWQKVFSPERYQVLIKDMVNNTCRVIEALQASDYYDTLEKRLGVLMCLKPARIDNDEITRSIRNESDLTQRSNLKTFIAKRGYARVPVYESTVTSTGRMIIIDGPQILTLRKKHRQLIKSSYDKGDIISIDYSSLEPRTAMAIAGQTPSGDIYEWIDGEIFDGKLGRTKAKTLTLSIIYGMSLHSAQSKYGNITVGTKKRLRDLFSVDEITKSLLETPKDELRNLFGRPIFPDDERKLFNSFIQSTAVDVAMLGFKQIITELKKNIECKPLFLIHDEIIFDVPNLAFNKVGKILKYGIDIKIKNDIVNFPVTVEKLNA